MLNAEKIERGFAMSMIDKEPDCHEIEALQPWHAAGAPFGKSSPCGCVLPPI